MSKDSDMDRGENRLMERKRTLGDLERLLPMGWLRPFGGWDWPTERFFQQGPAVDVIDRTDEIVLRAEVPGMAKDDIDVSVADDSVTIRGRVVEEKKDGRDDYFRHERRYGAFERTVAFPASVDPERAKAQIKDGVLELSLPKTERTIRKQVPIESA